MMELSFSLVSHAIRIQIPFFSILLVNQLFLPAKYWENFIQIIYF